MQEITVTSKKKKVKQPDHLGGYNGTRHYENKCERMCHLLTGVELMTTLHRLCAADNLVTAFLSLTEPSDGRPVVLNSALLS